MLSSELSESCGLPSFADSLPITLLYRSFVPAIVGQSMSLYCRHLCISSMVHSPISGPLAEAAWI